MHIQSLSGRNICILGFGREGQAALAAIERLAPAPQLTIADRNDSVKLPAGNYQKQLGLGYLQHLERFDVIVKSPGIPPLPELESVRQKIIQGTQIFLDTVKEAEATVVGITGSKGKSTTASLLHAILSAAGKGVQLVGNIGRPAIEYLAAAQSGTVFVTEMSSYQLANLTTSPHLAIITAFFPEHLDYHGSLTAYREAKTQIVRHQGTADTVLYPAQVPEAEAIAALSPGRKIGFTTDDAPVLIEETQLLGQHNLSNIAAAHLAATLLGVPRSTSVTAIKQFQGLPHRLQSLGFHHGITWVDDAISTTPESTIAALGALGDRVATIILGGQDRGNDFQKLGQVIAQSKAHNTILMGESAPRIRKALERAGVHLSVHEAQTMQEAVATARRTTSPGSICLLSPASPSYDMFRNFEEKGRRFAEEILGIRESAGSIGTHSAYA